MIAGLLLVLLLPAAPQQAPGAEALQASGGAADAGAGGRGGGFGLSGAGRPDASVRPPPPGAIQFCNRPVFSYLCDLGREFFVDYIYA